MQHPSRQDGGMAKTSAAATPHPPSPKVRPYPAELINVCLHEYDALRRKATAAMHGGEFCEEDEKSLK